MKAEDREYFLFRERQERAAALHSRDEARHRHEELASAYAMRVMYIDRGLFSDPAEAAEPAQQPPIQHIVIAA
jgi:hypothetical protein